MSPWQKRLEVAVNLAIFCAFLMVAALAAKRFFERPVDARARGPRVGAEVSLPGIDWKNSDLNLVLALSTGCHFCDESAGFYKRLIPTANSHGVQVLAVLPQPLSEGRTYLDSLGVSAPKVLESPLTVIGVSGTPTLLLLDRKGQIQKAWVGKLTPEGEQQVFSSLQP